MVKIAIVYYSLYGHIRKMAEAVKKGVEDAGHTATLLQLPETLSEEVLAKMHAPPKSDDAVVTLADLEAYDGPIFGLSGRQGQFSAQFKTFWDSTGSLWAAGKLIGKPAAVFASTAQQGGGQETIGLTLIPQLAHHGMIFVPLGVSGARVGACAPYGGCAPRPSLTKCAMLLVPRSLVCSTPTRSSLSTPRSTAAHRTARAPSPTATARACHRSLSLASP